MKIKLIIISLMFSLGLGLYAQNIDLHQFQTELQEKNEDVVSIKCRFKQTRQVSYLASAVEKEGDFTFTKPNDILLAFDDGDYTNKIYIFAMLLRKEIKLIENLDF